MHEIANRLAHLAVLPVDASKQILGCYFQMPDLETAIPVIRQSILAILRVRMGRPETVKKGKVRPARFEVAFTGSAFCVGTDRYLVTAFHVLNEGQPRNTKDRFYAFVVPGNGDPAFHFPVIGFPVERPDVDMAVLEVGPCATPGVGIPAVAVSFDRQPDGARVITVTPRLRSLASTSTAKVTSSEDSSFLRAMRMRASFPRSTSLGRFRSTSSTLAGITARAVDRLARWRTHRVYSP